MPQQKQALPQTFAAALVTTATDLHQAPILKSRGGWEAEAEQLVLAAYRMATGIHLSRIELHLRRSELFPREANAILLDWTQQRVEGKPLQYVVGYQTFFHHDYLVNPSVLIPRPETEILVETLIQWYSSRGFTPSFGIEVGLGSGAISIELLSHWETLKMAASELSPDALALAAQNAEKILGKGPTGSGRLDLISVREPQEVLEPFSGLKADFLVTNPPYLLRSSAEVDEDVEKYEPHLALFAPDSNPLYFYQKIAEQAQNRLKSRGVVFVELPHERALPIVDLFQAEGWVTKLILDLNQRNRVLIAELPS